MDIPFKNTTALLAALIVFAAVISLVSVYFAITLTKKKVVTGEESLIGTEGIARTNIDPEGAVLLDGTHWTAFTDEGTVIHKGSRVKVLEIKGLKLKVEKLVD